MNCTAFLRSPLSASYGLRRAILRVSFLRLLQASQGLPLAYQGNPACSCLALPFAMASAGLGFSGISKSLPFRLNPYSISKGKAILFPYDSGIHPAHASKACILSGLLRSSIVLALANIDNHCPCPDSCPWQAMLFASFLLYGLLPCPFGLALLA